MRRSRSMSPGLHRPVTRGSHRLTLERPELPLACGLLADRIRAPLLMFAQAEPQLSRRRRLPTHPPRNGRFQHVQIIFQELRSGRLLPVDQLGIDEDDPVTPAQVDLELFDPRRYRSHSRSVGV